MGSEKRRSAGRTLPLAIRGLLVLALPALVLLGAMTLTWSTLLEEGRVREDLEGLVTVQNDLEATASIVRRVANGLDLYLAAGLRGDLMPYHLANERLTALAGSVRVRTEDLPPRDRDALRLQVDGLVRDTLRRLQSVDQPEVPLDRSLPVFSHDLRQASDALVAAHTQATRARAAALIALHERRVTMMLWGAARRCSPA